ncbi:ABC-2 family transporter protein [Aquisphaera giovannonii]|uniref:ABC-2 family transporter protein n=1 Tax=Aquisphaera giovannonii TaxID=406548 RepID=A0A5B9W241_9BACT|nr:ABC transporter permease subunit [Aquisphaera giovannonii]QEH34633.1 ABC-2 family transporter protein [Aquisphaera giovannonii]
MSGRVGPGPMAATEWRMASRRWQGYALRSVTVMLLFGAMAPAWLEAPEGPGQEPTIRQQARAGNAAYQRTAILLLGLVGLAAPAATAGAVCQDKASGNLALLMATELRDAEIVLGKLAARLVPVLGVILCAAPVLVMETLLGGVDPIGIVGGLLVVLACAVFGCSLALTLSVWGGKAHEVLMATYAFGIVYLLAAPIWWCVRATLPASWLGPWLPSFWEVMRYNPIFLVLASVDGPSLPTAPVTIGTQAAFFGLGLGASALLIGLATWRIRPVAIRHLGRGDRAAGRRAWASRRSWGSIPGASRLERLTRRAWPGPSLDRNPVLWRECRRRRPSRWDLAVRGIYALLCGGFSAYAIAEMARGMPPVLRLGPVVNGLQVAAGLLLLCISAATSLAEERFRGSLDVLMASPLPTRAIVWGKWWGAFRSVPPLLILPAAVGLASSYGTGRSWAVVPLAALILAYGASITSLGLALATWLPRVGQASALTVGVYVFLSIAWIAFALSAFGEGPGDAGLGVAAGSPLVGVFFYSGLLDGKGLPYEFASQTIWTLFWAVAHGGIALALLLATLATFNRCLGRIDAPAILGEERGDGG